MNLLYYFPAKSPNIPLDCIVGIQLKPFTYSSAVCENHIWHKICYDFTDKKKKKPTKITQKKRGTIFSIIFRCCF